jgi:hypothetical protein
VNFTVGLIAAFLSVNRFAFAEDCAKQMSGYSTNVSTVEKIVFDSNAKLSLFEPGCLGKCPVFRLSVKGGMLQFEGLKFVRKKGKRSDHLSPQEVERLQATANRAKLGSMRENYCNYECPDGTQTIVLDSWETIIFIENASAKKSVMQCSGSEAKPPAEYFELHSALRELAKSRGWL